MLLGFAGEHRNAERLRLDDLRGKLRQHGEAAGDMEAAEADLIARRAKLTRDIHGARKLVRLHPDDADQRPAAPALEVADDPAREHAAIGLVVGVDLDPDARAQNLALAGVLGQAVHAGERVGRQRRAEPLDRIAVVVVVGRLDENEGEQRIPARANPAWPRWRLDDALMNWLPRRRICASLARAAYPSKSLAFAAFG